jgi:hypothetical protein
MRNVGLKTSSVMAPSKGRGRWGVYYDATSD